MIVIIIMDSFLACKVNYSYYLWALGQSYSVDFVNITYKFAILELELAALVIIVKLVIIDEEFLSYFNSLRYSIEEFSSNQPNLNFLI